MALDNNSSVCDPARLRHLFLLRVVWSRALAGSKNDKTTSESGTSCSKARLPSTPELVGQQVWWTVRLVPIAGEVACTPTQNPLDSSRGGLSRGLRMSFAALLPAVPDLLL